MADVLRKIKQAEQDAEKQLADAQAEVNKIAAEARRQSVQLIADATDGSVADTQATLDAARNKGISVPGDLAVIGFDDIPMAAWESYRLTTMRQPLRRMLDQAVDIILSAESYVGTGDIRVLAGELQERQSG